MKITCLTVGKKHSPAFARAIEVYEKRLRSMADFSFDYVPVSGKEQESTIILKRLKTEDTIWLLDETGSPINNTRLAEDIEIARNAAVKRIVIIIGGPYGVNNAVRKRSDRMISLSGLIFPHQLVRLIVVEQLYRSFNILRGGNYHHG